MHDYLIREMKPSEYPLLLDFLYEAIFQRDGTQLVPRTIINEPELQVYIKDFGNEKDDLCLCVEVDEEIVGAVWVRTIDGYGSIDAETPEFAIALYKEYRGLGIGTELMKRMLDLLDRKGYKKASLVVQKDNYAFQMYKKLGFKIVDENDEEYKMVYSRREGLL